MRLAALLYHDVLADPRRMKSGFSSPGADSYKMSQDLFAEHLDAISGISGDLPKLAYHPTLESCLDCPSLFTFDDGGVSGWTTIAAHLERHDFRGHFFIVTEFLDEDGFLSREQVQDLHERGHLIGSHSHTHPERISSLSDAEIGEEWKRSCRELGDLLARPVETASVPGGWFSPRVAAGASRAGIKLLYNSEPTSRLYSEGDLLVRGRFCLRRFSTARLAASLAAGHAPPALQTIRCLELKKTPQVHRRAALSKVQAGLPQLWALEGVVSAAAAPRCWAPRRWDRGPDRDSLAIDRFGS